MSLHIGTGVREISPERPMALYGYPHVDRILTGIHDPLLASVLVLQDEAGETLVLASLDLLMLDPGFARELRREVARRAGCPEERVFIGCTHTHSGPVCSHLFAWRNDPAVPPPEENMLSRIQSRLLEAVDAAMASRIRGHAAWTHADGSGVGGNRRTRGGLTDPECGILALRREEPGHELLGLLLLYGMHPTILHEDSTLVSSDFPHYTRLQIQERAGTPVTVVYLNAPSGNQSPRHYVDGQTFDEADRLGRKLGAGVCAALDAMSPDSWKGDARLEGRIGHVTLKRNPLRPLPEAQALLAECRESFEQLKREGAPRAEARTAECAVFGAEGSLALAQAAASGELEEALRSYRQVEVQTVRVGDACLVGFPGELFTEYALELKRRAPGKVYPASLVNGHLQGYIVTPDAAAEGGYEATNAVFAPESGTALVQTALELLIP